MCHSFSCLPEESPVSLVGLYLAEMVARTVAAYAGAQAFAAEDADGNQQAQTAPTPEEVLRRAHATSIAGVIDQIAQVASHAFEVFAELRADGERLNQRFNALSDRVDVVAAIVLDGDREAWSRLPSRDIIDRILRVRELSFPSSPRPMTQPMQSLYDKCEPLPRFEALVDFCPDISEYRNRYSNPEFLKQDWMQRESFRQQHAQQLRDGRRRNRKEQRRSLALAANGGAVSPTDPQDGDSDAMAMQQKLKFLNIRSWRERYGTGEGKELLKPPPQRDTNQLPEPLTAPGDKKKRRGSLSRKSLTLVKDGDDESAQNQQQSVTKKDTVEAPVSQVVDGVDSGDGKVILAQRLSTGGGSSAFSGAFMQEIEDPGDDLDLVDNPPPPAYPAGPSSPSHGSDGDAMAFVDQGLSYFDPFSSQPPPPPPLPPQEYDHDQDDYEVEDGWANGAPPPPPPRMSATGVYLDVDDDIPPPPPPAPPLGSSHSFADADSNDVSPSRRGSFVPPPPPPRGSFMDHEEHSTHRRDSYIPPPPPFPPPPSPPPVPELRPVPVVVRMPSILQELQTKRSELRHVDETTIEQTRLHPLPPNVLSPRLNLLQQIRLKQQLRPVQPRQVDANSRQAAALMKVPFASSIARILERRQVTTYASDDESDEDTDSDSDWK